MAKNLPKDTAAEFQPEEFTLGGVVEGSRAIDAGRAGHPDGEESEDTPLPDAENIEPSESAADDAPHSPDAGGEENPDEVAPTEVPIPHNPDFEFIVEADPSVSMVFSNWVVTEKLLDDGTFQVLTDDDGSYKPKIDPNDIPPEEIRAEILAEARVEAEKIKTDAEKEGFQEGYSRGQEEVREELRSEMVPLFEELRNSIQTVLNFREEILLESEKEIFELAVLFSKKVLHSELRLHPEVILDVVRHALERAVGWGEATVQVNPEDYKFLEEHRILLNEEGEGVNIARVDANLSIKRGGCILESNFGEIDVRIDRQIEVVEKSLRDALAERLESKDTDAVEVALPEGAVPAVSAEAAPAGEVPQPEEPGIPEQDPEDIKPYQPMDLGGDSGGDAPMGEDAS
ncbi:MAG: FliH/SctL family protein [Nitrospinota bacterium]